MATPKYPRKKTMLLKRYATQAALVALALGGALFYVFIHNAPPEDDALTALDRLATTITSEEGPGSAPAASPQGPGPDVTNATGAAVPTGNGTEPAQDAPRTAASLILEPGSAPVAAVPFSDKSLDAVAAEMSRRYAGRAPSAWGEHLPGVTDRLDVPGDGRTAPVLALTLDACGGKKGASFDAELIAFLREHKIPATIFVTSLWLRTNPETLRDLAGDPLFEIAAHGSGHKPCSVTGQSAYGIKGTASVLELVREVEGNARDLARATGTRPRWFRSGTAHYDDVAVSVIHDLGLGIAGYSVAADQGASLPAAKVAAKLKAARSGDILLLHVNKPGSGTCAGIKAALPALLAKGARFVRLSDGFE